MSFLNLLPFINGFFTKRIVPENLEQKRKLKQNEFLVEIYKKEIYSTITQKNSKIIF